MKNISHIVHKLFFPVHAMLHPVSPTNIILLIYIICPEIECRENIGAKGLKPN